MVPLKSKDRPVLFKDLENIMKHWTELFMDLFYNPSIFNDDIINKLTEFDIIDEMLDHPSLEKKRKC